MAKPKLLLVTDTYHPKVDGTVRFIEEFCQRTAPFFDTTILAPQFTKSLKSTPSIRLLPTSRILKPLPNYPLIRLSLKNIHTIRSEVKKSDIVFIQGPAILSLLAFHYARKYKKISIAYFHVLPWELYEKSASHPLKGIISRIILKLCSYEYNRADLLLYPYGELAATMIAHGFIASNKLARLGVDINRFYPAADKRPYKQKLGIEPHEFVIGYVGRLSPEKNIGTLVCAMRKMESPSHLLLVGDGDREQRKIVQRYPRHTITGFVDNVEDYLKAVDIFVMPSLTETTSLATLEAMSSGLPVISTKVGYAQRYIIKNYNGLFFPSHSPTVLSKKLDLLKSNPQLRVKLGLNARKTVAYSFSWDRSITRIRKLLLDLYDKQ